jgi:hypothetical protein
VLIAFSSPLFVVVEVRFFCKAFVMPLHATRTVMLREVQRSTALQTHPAKARNCYACDPYIQAYAIAKNTAPL